MDHPDDDNGQIDPARLDVATAKKPKRNPRKRLRDDPPAELKGAEDKWRQRALARNHPPGIIREPNGKGGHRWAPPHNDDSLWRLQLGECFATRSQGAIDTFLRQLEALLDQSFDHGGEKWWANERQFAAVLDMVSGLKPKNSMEAALAAQMVAVHILTMKVGAYAIRHEYDHRQAATLSKLARTFAGQVDTMQSLQGKRRKGSQTIKVKKELHQHVHYHHHRGDGEADARPHGRDDTGQPDIIDQRPLVRREDAGGNVLPLPRPERQDKVQAARRKVGGGDG